MARWDLSATTTGYGLSFAVPRQSLESYSKENSVPPGNQSHLKDGHRVPAKDCTMAPNTFLMQDPCPVG